MVYYNENEIIIRNMQQSDAQIITDGEIAQGWDADIEKYECGSDTKRKANPSLWLPNIRVMSQGI